MTLSRDEMRRGRRNRLRRMPWLMPALAMLAALALLLVLGAIAGRVTPPISAPSAKPVAPLALATPPAINYGFYDWTNIDYQNMFPEAGPMGSLAVFPWRRIHTNDNQFDWRAIDTYLEAAQKMTVTLDNGTVITKPVIIEIVDNESTVPSKEVPDAPYPPLTPNSPYFFFDDYTPQWILDRLRQPIQPITYVQSLNPLQIGQLTSDMGSYLAIGRPGTSACGWPVVVFAPKYNNPTWLNYYKQMVYALGKRYNNDQRVSAVIFGPGIDSEFGQATKPFFGCDLRNMLYQQSGMTENDYLQTTVRPGAMNDIADYYRAAFPTKPLYLQFTSAGKSTIDRLIAQNHNPPIGLKQATLVFDNNNQWQDDGNGTIQLMMRYSVTQPIAWENALAYTGGQPRSNQIRYFTLLAGLTSFPGFMDFIGGWPVEKETLDSGMFDFQRRYLGRTITDTDEIWVAMRDTTFWPPTGGSLRFGGWPDDFSYGLYRPDGIAGNLTQIITTTHLTQPPFSLTSPITTHMYSLAARTTGIASGNPYMSFAADQRWRFWGQTPLAVSPGGVWYDITLKYVDLGSDGLSIQYLDYGGVTRTRTIRKHDTGQWVTTTLTLRDAYLHGQMPGGADFRLSAEADTGGVDEIVHMAMVKAHVGTEPTPTPALARATRTPLPAYEQRVNAGGAAYVDSKGLPWLSDQGYKAGGWGYVGGNTYTATMDVGNVADAALYKTQRWWADRGAYQFDVPNGNYKVDLSFAESLRDKKDQRLFDVLIEGQPVLQNFDAFVAGGYNKAFTLTFPAVVTDGQLTVEFVAHRDSAFINALHVVSAGAEPAATPTAPSIPTRYTATATATLAAGKATPVLTRTPTPVPTQTTDQMLQGLEERYRASRRSRAADYADAAAAVAVVTSRRAYPAPAGSPNANP